MWIRIYLGLWIRIRIQRYKITDKIKGKAELNQQKKKFSQEIIFFKSEPKKSRFKVTLKKNIFFTFKNLKMFWKLGDFIDLYPDPDTINPDPHHW